MRIRRTKLIAAALTLCMVLSIAVVPASAMDATSATPAAACNDLLSRIVCHMIDEGVVDERLAAWFGFGCSPADEAEKPSEPSEPEIKEPEVPEAETPETGTSEFSEFAQEVLRLVNIERAKQGVAALKLDVTVCKAAQVRAVEACTYFSHTRPNGTSCFTALDEAGVSYTTAGENIASGYSTPAAVVTAWMNSEGHAKNILNSNFTTLGVGVYACGGSYAWSQFFTR